MDKLQKVLNEVERLQNELITEKKKGNGSDVDDACILELQNIKNYIKFVQEEPVSKELEEAANNAIIALVPSFGQKYSDGSYVSSFRDCFKREELLELFKAGANWQKEKDEEEKVLIYKHGWDDCKEHIMKNAFDAEVLENYDGKVIKYDETILDKKLSNCEVFDKVKVIIIKEN